jgi:hypothetical protein
MLAKRLEKIPAPEPKTDIPSTLETTVTENVDWGIETLRLGIPIVRILKRHEIHTLKDLTKNQAMICKHTKDWGYVELQRLAMQSDVTA